MTISDVIYDSISHIIDEVYTYFDKPRDMTENEDIVEVIAAHLKVWHKSWLLSPTEEQKKAFESRNWQDEAKQFIKDYLEENYMSEDE